MDESATLKNDNLLSIKNGSRSIFYWFKKQKKPYWISFLLVSTGNSMTTAIYSFLSSWRFPEVSMDVPYYYHEPKPPPQLIRNQKYEAIYMAIDSQGWVTVVSKKNWIQPN